MLHIKNLDEGLELFKALGSDVRVEIIKILIKESGMNMNELASRLKITNGALTSHIRKLEECGVVTVSAEASGHGNQKVCSVNLDKILIVAGTRLVHRRGVHVKGQGTASLEAERSILVFALVQLEHAVGNREALEDVWILAVVVNIRRYTLKRNTVDGEVIQFPEALRVLFSVITSRHLDDFLAC